ncbi:MAG TPA: hypothetical protein VMN58_06035 [Acidimicrobiales bacterium]|nr:hypothetical protein [Acidimicrobiales bacterium]
MVVVGNGIAGGWALAAHGVETLRGRALWWFTAAAQLAIVAQVVVGVVLVAGEGRTVEQLHQLYGFVALIGVGILYSYRAQLRGQVYLLYGFGGLFLMGLAIRAMILHGPA